MAMAISCGCSPTCMRVFKKCKNRFDYFALNAIGKANLCGSNFQENANYEASLRIIEYIIIPLPHDYFKIHRRTGGLRSYLEEGDWWSSRHKCHSTVPNVTGHWEQRKKSRRNYCRLGKLWITFKVIPASGPVRVIHNYSGANGQSWSRSISRVQFLNRNTL